MSDLTIAGSTSYPSSLDTRTVLTDGSVSGSDMVSANVNGPAAAVIAIETELGTLPKGSAASVAGRLATALNNDGTVKSSVIAGTGVSYSGGVFTISVLPPNWSISASIASNALTITLLSPDGSALSVGKPALIPFRNATLTSGVISDLTVTVGTSITVPSTVTLGTLNSTAARIYVGAINNAGTVELCVWNSQNGLSLFGVSEDALISTSAVSGGNSAGVVYSTTARSSVPITVLGYIEISEVTAGTWNATPTVVQTMGPGVRRTGDRVQRARTQTGTGATGTTIIPFDNTIPQSTEGDQYMSLAITPTSTLNLLQVTAQALLANSINGFTTLALFQDATANALAAIGGEVTTGGGPWIYSLDYQMAAGTVSATTFKLRAGPNSAGTVYFNEQIGSQVYGGVCNSFMDITEVFV